MLSSAGQSASRYFSEKLGSGKVYSFNCLLVQSNPGQEHRHRFRLRNYFIEVDDDFVTIFLANNDKNFMHDVFENFDT